MFILTCPACSHRSKVKFARMGATAKCVACGESFEVDAATLAMQTPGTPGTPRVPAVGDEAKVAPPAIVIEHAAPVEELVVHRPPAPRPAGNAIAGEGVYRAPAPTSTSFLRRLDPVLVGLFIMLIVGTAALLMVMLRGDDEDLRNNGAPTLAEQPPSPTTPTISTNPPAPAPGTSPQIAKNPPNALAPAVASGAQLPADIATNLPTMSLYGSLGYQPTWATIDPPRDPDMPMMETGGLLWLPRIQKQSSGEGLFTAIFMSDEPMVYGSGFLQVQLINAAGKVYAEIKQTVPVLPVRQSVEMRIPVSGAFMQPFDRMIAEFTPLNPLEDAVPLELAESNTRVLSQGAAAGASGTSGGSGGPLVQVSLANPFSFAVVNPTVVLGILSTDGWPLGEWRGTMQGQIAPHGTLTFKASPPLSSDEQAGRIVLRAFAHRQGGN